MRVSFESFTPSTGDEKLDVPTEFIRIPFPATSPDAAPDEVFRPATDEDRAKYAQAYADFKKGPAPVEVKNIPVSRLPEPPPDFMPGFAEPEPEHHETKHKKGHK